MDKLTEGKAKKIIIYLLVVGIFLSLFYFNLFQGLKNKAYDMLLIFRYVFSPPEVEEVVLVTINENTINELGGWPLSRRYYAQALNKLETAEAEVIGVDLIFSETKKGDKKLERVLKKYDNIVLPVVAQLEVRRSLKKENIKVNGINLPIKQFSSNSSLGHINYIPDRDGIIRRLPLDFNYKGQKYISFNLQIADKYTSLAGVKNSSNLNELLLNFPGPARTIPRISFLNLLNDQVEKSFFKDKIVLIGTDSPGLGDKYMTSFSRYGYLSGVEINGQAVYNLINSNYIKPVSTIFNIIILAILALLHILIFINFNPIRSALITVFTFLAYITVNLTSFYYYRYYFTLVSPLLLIAILYILSIVIWYLTTERKREFIRNMFSRYVSGEVLQELTNNPELAQPGGKKMEVSVIFVDIRNFTCFARDKDAKQVVESLNNTFTVLSEIIIDYQGTLDKYLGDGFIAFFGAPIPDKSHTQNCLEAAYKIQRLSNQDFFPYKLGIGIDTGSVIVGNIGSEKMMDYTIIGNSVNRAARFVDIAREDEIIVSQNFWTKIALKKREDLKEKLEVDKENTTIGHNKVSLIRLLRRGQN